MIIEEFCMCMTLGESEHHPPEEVPIKCLEVFCGAEKQQINKNNDC